MREHVCPTCGAQTNMLHGSKVLCPCGCLSDMSGNILERRMKTGGAVKNVAGMVLCPPTGALHLIYAEAFSRHMPNYEHHAKKIVEYTIEERDGAFVVFSRVHPLLKDGTGHCTNWVADKDTYEEAEELVSRLKRL